MCPVVIIRARLRARVPGSLATGTVLKIVPWWEMKLPGGHTLKIKVGTNLPFGRTAYPAGSAYNNSYSISSTKNCK